MTRHDPAVKAGPSEGGTSRHDTNVPDQRTVGTFVRTLADPELLAVDMLEKLGPVACVAIAQALLDLVSTSGRVIA